MSRLGSSAAPTFGMKEKWVGYMCIFKKEYFVRLVELVRFVEHRVAMPNVLTGLDSLLMVALCEIVAKVWLE